MSLLPRLTLSLLVSACLLCLVSAHPHPSPSPSQLTGKLVLDRALFVQPEGEVGPDYHPVKLGTHMANETVYYSYHIHVYWLNGNYEQAAAANDLRNDFIRRFKPVPCQGACGTWCPDACFWDLNKGPVGPHPVASFGLYIPLEIALEAINWVSINHGTLSVLVHPNSGFPIIDHNDNSLWIGHRLPLDNSKLDPIDPPPPMRISEQ